MVLCQINNKKIKIKTKERSRLKYSFVDIYNNFFVFDAHPAQDRCRLKCGNVTNTINES